LLIPHLLGKYLHLALQIIQQPLLLAGKEKLHVLNNLHVFFFADFSVAGRRTFFHFVLNTGPQGFIKRIVAGPDWKISSDEGDSRPHCLRRYIRTEIKIAVLFYSTNNLYSGPRF